jgi:hypothetical protein
MSGEPAGATEHRPQKAGETADVRSNNAHHASAFQPKTPADAALTEMFRGTQPGPQSAAVQDGWAALALTTPNTH